MLPFGLLYIFLSMTWQEAPKDAKPAGAEPTEAKQAIESERATNLAESPDDRVNSKPQIAPGPPPVLSFRFYEGKLHHRLGNSELLLDDAGH